MQQLTLFSKTVSRSMRVKTTKQSRNNVRQTQVSTTHLGLWAEDAHSEKEMALFFLDIRNFTPLVEKYQPADVIHIVKKLFSTFQNIIRIHHGRIIETSGDGFYAAFGFDRDITEAVNAAVKAGMTILKTLEDMNSETFEKNLRQRVEVGIGVHVGKVATGNLHIGSKDHMVVMGYPVNVAARLQSATRELNNNFIISAAVYKLLTHPQLNSVPVTVSLKGITKPWELYLIGNSYMA